MTSTQTRGRRAENDDEFFAAPAVWWKLNLDGEPRWMVRPPCGHHFMLAHGFPRHEVEEHDDGMITVAPQPSNSNSILCPTWRVARLYRPRHLEGRMTACWYDAVLGAWIFNDEDDDA